MRVYLATLDVAMRDILRFNVAGMSSHACACPRTANLEHSAADSVKTVDLA